MSAVLAGILVIALSGVASAQEAPVGATDEEEVVVTLTGVFVEHIEDNDYLFEHDGTRIVASGGPLRYHTLDLPLDVEVTVTGVIGDGPPWLEVPQEPELDLHSVSHGDTVIEIRSGVGPPPWAGGPFGGVPGAAGDDEDDDGEGPPSWVRDMLAAFGF